MGKIIETPSCTLWFFRRTNANNWPTVTFEEALDIMQVNERSQEQLNDIVFYLASFNEGDLDLSLAELLKLGVMKLSVPEEGNPRQYEGYTNFINAYIL